MKTTCSLIVAATIATAAHVATGTTYDVPSGTTTSLSSATETSRTVKTGDGTLEMIGTTSLKSVKVSAGTVKFNGGSASISDSSATGTGSDSALFAQDAGSTVIAGGATVTASAGKYIMINNGTFLVTNATFDATGISGDIINADYAKNTGESRIVIADGGVLKANIIRPSGTYESSRKETVSVDLNRGGKLYLKRFWCDSDKHRYGRINFDGGTLYTTEAATSTQSTWLFQEDTVRIPWKNSDITPTVREGGFHLNTAGDNYVHVPFVSGAAKDGGAHFSGSGTLFWYTGNSTYNGGTYLESDNNATLALSASYGGDAALGAVPATPQTNIWVTGKKHMLFSGNNTTTIHRNRTVFIPDGGQMLLGSQGRLVIGGEIRGENAAGLDYPKTLLDVYFAAKEHSGWDGTVVIGPGEGRTNDVGRLRVGGCLEVSAGVTRVAGSGAYTGVDYAMVYVCGNNSAYNDAKGHLIVNGGTLATAQSDRFVVVRDYGHLEVTNAGKIDMPFATVVNGHSSRGTTTIAGGGELCVTNFQVANGGTSILNLRSGGMLASYQLWNNNSSATVNFDGGGIRWAGSREDCFTQGSKGTIEGDWANTTLVVKEGGAVIDTQRNLSLAKPLVSGAERDGGLVKRGSAVLLLRTAMAYNGPTRVEAGTIQARVDNAIPASTLVLTNGGHISFSKYDTSDHHTYTHVAQTLHRIEGNGTVEYCRNLHVTNSVAPGASGTLTFEYPANLNGDFEVCGDANGCGKLYFERETQDISGLTLKVVDFSALDPERGAAKAGVTGYQILSIRTSGGASYTGKFKLSDDWPGDWKVKYTPSGAYLQYVKGSLLIVR